VKIPDVNLLIYAVDELSPAHVRIRPWWESVLSGDEAIGFSWNVLLGFVRLSTRAPSFANPLPVDVAFDLVDLWLSRPNALVLQPTERHAALMRELLSQAGTAGNLTTDGHIAALAIEYDGEVCSADNDFRRFRGLRWMNPLA
jgi:toxin-antitoxin system PIN domain toxin